MRTPTLALLAVGVACAAQAMEVPQPETPLQKGGDPHVRVAKYTPGQIYQVVGALGRPVMLTFGPDETIQHVLLDQGYQTPSGATVPPPWSGPPQQEQERQPLRNMLPLWPTQTGRSSGQIITGLPDGSRHFYPLALVTLPRQPDDCPDSGAVIADCDDPRIISQLTFLYGPETKKIDPAIIKQAADRRAVQQRTDAEARLKVDFFYGQRNWNYMAQGKPAAVHDLAPDQTSDNGEITGFRYVGNRRTPAFYIVEKGVPRQVTPESRMDMLLVYETIPGCPPEQRKTDLQGCPHWELRRDPEVVDLYNFSNDQTGVNPYTGTTSPEIVRVVRDQVKQ